MPTDIQDTTVEKITGNSLPVQWLGLSTFTAMDPDLMPGCLLLHGIYFIAVQTKNIHVCHRITVDMKCRDFFIFVVHDEQHDKIGLLVIFVGTIINFGIEYIQT